MHEEPWLLAPQLQQARIEEIAGLLIQVRREVIDRHEPAIGDTRLSLGMRAYECCRSRIIRQAKEKLWPWLSILTPEGRFTFSIDGVPVRFSRNEPGSLPGRKLIPSEEGQEQMSLFEASSPYANIRWFLVVDTHYDVPVENAFFVGYSEFNEIVCKWKIPLEDIVHALTAVNDHRAEAVDVPPAELKLKAVERQQEENTPA